MPMTAPILRSKPDPLYRARVLLAEASALLTEADEGKREDWEDALVRWKARHRVWVDTR